MQDYIPRAVCLCYSQPVRRASLLLFLLPSSRRRCRKLPRGTPKSHDPTRAHTRMGDRWMHPHTLQISHRSSLSAVHRLGSLPTLPRRNIARCPSNQQMILCPGNDRHSHSPLDSGYPFPDLGFS
jgi:hypothetical protein